MKHKCFMPLSTGSGVSGSNYAHAGEGFTDSLVGGIRKRNGIPQMAAPPTIHRTQMQHRLDESEILGMNGRHGRRHNSGDTI
jgi:hypothetical protein